MKVAFVKKCPYKGGHLAPSSYLVALPCAYPLLIVKVMTSGMMSSHKI